MPVFHSKLRLPESWNKPEIKEITEKALDLKSEINKLTSQNTWQLKAIVRMNSKDFETLSVSTCIRYSQTIRLKFLRKMLHYIFLSSLLQRLQNSETSSTSELCEICQISSITLLKDDSCSSFDVTLEDTKQPLCKRCRRHPEPETEELCDRCSDVLSSAWFYCKNWWLIFVLYSYSQRAFLFNNTFVLGFHAMNFLHERTLLESTRIFRI